MFFDKPNATSHDELEFIYVYTCPTTTAKMFFDKPNATSHDEHEFIYVYTSVLTISRTANSSSRSQNVSFASSRSFVKSETQGSCRELERRQVEYADRKESW